MSSESPRKRNFWINTLLAWNYALWTWLLDGIDWLWRGLREHWMFVLFMIAIWATIFVFWNQIGQNPAFVSWMKKPLMDATIGDLAIVALVAAYVARGGRK